MSRDRYESPLLSRYASAEMSWIFSPDMKFRTWRKLWIALARAEREMGIFRKRKPASRGGFRIDWSGILRFRCSD